MTASDRCHTRYRVKFLHPQPLQHRPTCIQGFLRQNEVQRWCVLSDTISYVSFLRLRAEDAELFEKWGGCSYVALDVVWMKMLTRSSVFRRFVLSAQIAQGPLCGTFLDTQKDHVVCSVKRSPREIQRPSNKIHN